MVGFRGTPRPTILRRGQRPYSEARATEEDRRQRGGETQWSHGTMTEQEKSAFTRWVEAILSPQHQDGTGDDEESNVLSSRVILE